MFFAYGYGGEGLSRTVPYFSDTNSLRPEPRRALTQHPFNKNTFETNLRGACLFLGSTLGEICRYDFELF